MRSPRQHGRQSDTKSKSGAQSWRQDLYGSTAMWHGSSCSVRVAANPSPRKVVGGKGGACYFGTEAPTSRKVQGGCAPGGLPLGACR